MNLDWFVHEFYSKFWNYFLDLLVVSYEYEGMKTVKIFLRK